ncbi:hypothetical protein TREES_T100014093 [Tupaia chinensis]|uniref:Uncharacterized protein n=1 Tax=Tupaia chinensis TaxID=246437 RepID=L9KL99_TUPCH|nr:hypothetical protein TREES_T100014093 [Tupaia chinensis]
MSFSIGQNLEHGIMLRRVLNNLDGDSTVLTKTKIGLGQSICTFNSKCISDQFDPLWSSKGIYQWKLRFSQAHGGCCLREEHLFASLQGEMPCLTWRGQHKVVHPGRSCPRSFGPQTPTPV